MKQFLRIHYSGTDIEQRPYLIISPEPLPEKKGKPLIAQFVLYWDNKKEAWNYYATTRVKKIRAKDNAIVNY